jgi:hypothetical protein
MAGGANSKASPRRAIRVMCSEGWFSLLDAFSRITTPPVEEEVGTHAIGPCPNFPSGVLLDPPGTHLIKRGVQMGPIARHSLAGMSGTISDACRLQFESLWEPCSRPLRAL